MEVGHRHPDPVSRWSRSAGTGFSRRANSVCRHAGQLHVGHVVRHDRTVSTLLPNSPLLGSVPVGFVVLALSRSYSAADGISVSGPRMATSIVCEVCFSLRRYDGSVTAELPVVRQKHLDRQVAEWSGIAGA